MSLTRLCTGCSASDYTQSAWRYDKDLDSVLCVSCDKCSAPQSTIHDVYFRQPYYSQALDMEFTSKAQKAAYLKEHGLSEAGDIKQSQRSWEEGSRAYRQKQFDRDRPMIRETYGRYLANARRK